MNTDAEQRTPIKWGAEIRAGEGSLKGVAEEIKGFWSYQKPVYVLS